MTYQRITPNEPSDKVEIEDIKDTNFVMEDLILNSSYEVRLNLKHMILGDLQNEKILKVTSFSSDVDTNNKYLLKQCFSTFWTPSPGQQ